MAHWCTNRISGTTKVLPFYIHRLISFIKKTDDRINYLCVLMHPKVALANIACSKCKQPLRGKLTRLREGHALSKEVTGIPIWDVLVYVFRWPSAGR